MTFHIGQRVVCVDVDERCSCHAAPPLTKHAIYTVSWAGSDGVHGPIDCIKVSGFVWKVALAADRFRPLEEKPERIAIFREIARGITEGWPIIPDNEKVDHLIHLSAVSDLHGFSIHNGNGKSRGFEPKLFQQPLNLLTMDAAR